MLQKFKHYLKEMLFFILVLVILANIVSLYKSADINKTPLSLSNIKLVNNAKFIIDDSKPTLIHFWAIWCPTCKLEASNIQSISKSNQVITVCVKSGSNKDIQEWMQTNQYSFSTINDGRGTLSSQYNIGVFPTTLIYDKDKNLVFSDVGYTSTWGLMLRMWWAGI